MRFINQLNDLTKPYRVQLLLSLVTLLAATATQLFIPRIIQNVIDIGLIERNYQYILNAALLILVIGVVRAFLLFWQRYISVWISQKIAFDLRNKLYDHIQRLSFTYHDHSQTGQIISRCIEDVNATNQFTGFGLVEIIRIVLLMIGITVLLFIQNWQLALIAMLPMIPLFILTSQFGQRISQLFYKMDKAMGDLSARLQENVSGVQVVRAFARETYEIERFDHSNRKLYQAHIEAFGEFSKIFPTTQLLIALGTILIVGFGGAMVIRGEMTFGEVVAFNAYLILLATPAQQLVWVVNLGGEAFAGLNRIYEVLDEEIEIDSPSDPIPMETLEGRIVFDNVSLQYKNDPAYALRNINFKIEPNQVIALIGMTGSGKTSLVNLIPRFYDVTTGSVKIDDVDVRHANLHQLRKHIGIVLQTSLLFSDTIAENIGFGKPDATDEEIIAAARAAQAHDFILELPEGYNTIVGERGLTLSGGQRQRVAIARALLMNPRILILDDSTSSVDTETEQLIQEALDHLMEGRTTFIIAHRLATVRKADVIFVLDRGEIVQAGTHNELFNEPGIYREIYDLQLNKHGVNEGSNV